MITGNHFYFHKSRFPIYALLISFVIVFSFYAPLLQPIIDRNLNFFTADLSNMIMANPQNMQINYFFSTFMDHSGASSIQIPSMESDRFFLLGGGIRLILGFVNPTYSQLFSIIILISLLIGSYGLFRITGIYEKDAVRRSFIIIPIILFYYLNLWSVQRIVHFWIWTAYAVIPVFLWLGLSFIQDKKNSYLLLYSLVYAFFGPIPHAFLFLLIIHIFLIAFLLVKRENVKKILMFSIIPIIVYLLTNLPFLLISSINEGYPVYMTLEQLTFLSKYGELIILLTFSNNWWPQVPLETIFNNLAFRLSSFGIIVCVLATLFVYRRLNKNELKMMILSLIFFLAIIFVALGTNNPMLLGLLQLLGQYQILDLVAPLREWARISILIPIFMVLIFTVCSSKFKNREKITAYILLALVGVNIFASPALIYLNEVYSPVHVPQEYYNLSSSLPLDHKTLYIYPSQAEDIFGSWRYVWNPDKVTSNIIELSIGSTYPDNSDFYQLIKNKELPPTLLNAFNIKYVMQRTDILGASDFKVEYKDLNVTKLQYLTLYENQDDVKPFLIYSSGILVGDDGKDMYSLASAMSSPLVAPTQSPANDTIFALYDFSSYALYQGLTEAGKGIIIAPFDFSYRYNPSDVWSKGTTNELLHVPWHPYLEELNIENWESDYRRGLVFTWANNSNTNDLRMTFEITNASDYHLLMRYLENSKGGSLQVFLDDVEISVSSLNQLNSFVWKDLGEFHLEKGMHSIVLRNIDGFNAVNLFSLVQSQDLTNIENGIEETFQNKTMIYILEGESDLYYENANIEKSPQASFGEILALSPNGKAWQDINIIKEGFYSPALLLNGIFKVTFDNTTYYVKSDGLNYTYLDPIYLLKGLHKIQIETAYVPPGGSCNIDVVWIYMVNSFLTPEELFHNNEVPAIVNNYTKVDPTLWELQINSTKPFILSFSEAYDPSWEAQVYKDGILVEKTQPIKLYNFINGFYLNTTGTNLEVQIVYTQQEHFNVGLIFTGLTLAFIFLYPLYNWRSKKKLQVLTTNQNLSESYKFKEDSIPKPLVSIVIPTLNSERTLVECLESIKAQTYKEIETIVIDAKSVDDTPAIAKRYGVTFKQSSAGGVSKQRNLGVIQARADWILLVDSDEILSRNLVKNCVDIIREKEYLGLFIATIDTGYSYYGKSRFLGHLMNYVLREEPQIPNSSIRFYHKQIFDAVAGYDEDLDFGEDSIFALKCLAKKFPLGRSNSHMLHFGVEGLKNIFYKNYLYGKKSKIYLEKAKELGDETTIEYVETGIFYIKNALKFKHYIKYFLGFFVVKLIEKLGLIVGKVIN